MGEWQPMNKEPGDCKLRLYGLHVRNRNSYEWFEVHYLARDEDTGDMRHPSGDVFSEWSFDDFEVWADAPTFAAQRDRHECAS